MKKILHLFTIVIMALLSWFIFVTRVTAQPVDNNQEIFLCIKYQPNETILLPNPVVFKSQSNTLLESSQELIQNDSSSNDKEEKGDTLF